MKNRQKVIEILKAGVSDKLQQELNYFLEVDREYDYDLADALTDAEDFVYESGERGLRQEIRKVLIEAGCYVLAPVNTVAIGKDDRFCYKGDKYNFPHGGGMEWWLDADE
jgi:hypothetical protein